MNGYKRCEGVKISPYLIFTPKDNLVDSAPHCLPSGQEVMDKVTRQCPQTTTFLKSKKTRSVSNRVLPLTSLTPYR